MRALVVCFVGSILGLSACWTDGELGEDGGDLDNPVVITHAFGPLALPAFKDDTSRCASWRLDNSEALYVQAVQLANEGSFHHSNWIVVPEDAYPGSDGYWRCGDRGFEEISATQLGTVLFAQSTQSYAEDQRLAPGAVIKIPPRHKIIGLLHTLNASPRDTESRLWLSLELVHPRAVTSVVTPLSLQYRALDIPPQSESRFTGTCDLNGPHSFVTFKPLDLRLHYILPHYHYLGNYFDVEVVGGKLDGQSVYRLEGFNGEGNGLTFDPPLELPGATGLRFTCGYNNWRDRAIGWGDGDGEMCVMLALVEADAILGGSAEGFSTLVSNKDGIRHYEAPCIAAAGLKSAKQGLPSQAELQAPLYVPPVAPEDADLPPVPPCQDIDPAIAADGPATLASIRETLFAPSCSFSACHGDAALAGLDFQTADLHAALVNRPSSGSDLPLVSPGKPDESWLYQVLSRCEPVGRNGQPARHMPLNAPFLLDPAVVNKVRAWIADGAPND